MAQDQPQYGSIEEYLAANPTYSPVVETPAPSDRLSERLPTGTGAALLVGSFIPGVSPFAAAGLAGLSALEAFEHFREGEYQEGAVAAVFTAIGGGVMLHGIRKVMQGAKQAGVAEDVVQAGAKVVKKAQKAAGLGRTPTASSVGDEVLKDIDDLLGILRNAGVSDKELKRLEVLRRALRESRLSVRAFTGQGRQAPADLLDQVEADAKLMSQLVHRALGTLEGEVAAAPAVVRKAASASGAIAALMTKLGGSADDVARVKAIISNIGKQAAKAPRAKAPRAKAPRKKPPTATAKEAAEKKAAHRALQAQIREGAEAARRAGVSKADLKHLDQVYNSLRAGKKVSKAAQGRADKIIARVEKQTQALRAEKQAARTAKAEQQAAAREAKAVQAAQARAAKVTEADMKHVDSVYDALRSGKTVSKAAVQRADDTVARWKAAGNKVPRNWKKPTVKTPTGEKRAAPFSEAALANKKGRTPQANVQAEDDLAVIDKVAKLMARGRPIPPDLAKRAAQAQRRIAKEHNKAAKDKAAKAAEDQRPKPEAQRETTEEFLARGGKITRPAETSRSTLASRHEDVVKRNKAIDDSRTRSAAAKAERERAAKVAEDAQDAKNKAELAKLKGNNPKDQVEALDELGQNATTVLLGMGAHTSAAQGIGVVVGAGLGHQGGAAMGRNEEERRKYAIIGALAGGASGAVGAKLLASLKAETLTKDLSNYTFFSFLSSPTAMGNATVGAYAGAWTGVLTKVLEGALTRKETAQAMKHLVPWTFAKNMIWAARNKNAARVASVGRRSKAPRQAGGGILSLPTDWVIIPADFAASKALRAAKWSVDDMSNLMLSGDTKVKGFQILQRAMGGSTKRTGQRLKRMEIGRNPKARLMAQQLFPFPRVVANALERGTEFSPLGMIPGFRRAMGNTVREGATRASMGTIAGTGAGMASSSISPELDPLVSAMGGPMALPVMAGLKMARGMSLDQAPSSIINTLLGELPALQEQTGLGTLTGRLVPGGMRAIAEAIDPAHGRMSGPTEVAREFRRRGLTTPGSLGETALGFAGAAISRIPGWREALPERDMPKDIFGRDLFPDRAMFTPRFGGNSLLETAESLRQGRLPEGDGSGFVMPHIMTSRPIINPPIFPEDDPLAQQIKGIQDAASQYGPLLTAPALLENEADRRNLLMAGVQNEDIPRDIRGMAQRAKGAALEQPLEALLASPRFQALPPELKSQVLRRAIQQIRQSSSAGITGLAGASPFLNESQQGNVRTALQTLIANLARGGTP